MPGPKSMPTRFGREKVIRRHFSNPIHHEWRPAVYFGHGVMKNLVRGLQSEGGVSLALFAFRSSCYELGSLATEVSAQRGQVVWLLVKTDSGGKVCHFLHPLSKDKNRAAYKYTNKLLGNQIFKFPRLLVFPQKYTIWPSLVSAIQPRKHAINI